LQLDHGHGQEQRQHQHQHQHSRFKQHQRRAFHTSPWRSKAPASSAAAAAAASSPSSSSALAASRNRRVNPRYPSLKTMKQDVSLLPSDLGLFPGLFVLFFYFFISL
jgi:ABC-type Zn2+ transport system substrate-binding protein/surface adhesin